MRRSTDLKRKTGGVFAVFAVLAGLMIAFAAPAFAHHSEIAAGADCDGVVTWRATAWTDASPTQQERTNNDVRVWYRITTSSFVRDVEVADGAFNIGNGYSFDGTFDFPDGQTTITVFVQEQVKWGTAADGANPAQRRSAVVTLPTDCPTPDITIRVECTKVVITSTKDLSNIIWQQGAANSQRVEGLTGTTYELVNDPANPITAVWVKSGNNKVVSPPDPLPNPPFDNNQGIGAYFAVAAPTGCTGDAVATAKVECTSDGGTITVTLENKGGTLPVTYKVTNPTDGTDVRTVEVAVGATKTESFPGLSDGTYTVPITAQYPGGPLLDKTISGLTVDCDGVPQVSSSSICTADGGVVSLVLSNTAPAGNKAVEFVVSGPGTPDGPTTVSVAAGGSTTLKFSGVADGTATYEITADGEPLADQVLQIDCAGVPAVKGSAECTADGGVVTLELSNTATEGQGRRVRGERSGYAGWSHHGVGGCRWFDDAEVLRCRGRDGDLRDHR